MITTVTMDAPVRMVLYGYDGDPDGDGMHEVLNKEFASEKAALEYRRDHTDNACWGRIEWLDGTFVKPITKEPAYEAVLY